MAEPLMRSALAFPVVGQPFARKGVSQVPERAEGLTN
jgi:hypothetical protein